MVGKTDNNGILKHKILIHWGETELRNEHDQVIDSTAVTKARLVEILVERPSCRRKEKRFDIDELPHNSDGDLVLSAFFELECKSD
jgi:hypothetical protein